MCLSDEDCGDGVCDLPDFAFCVQLCSEDADCDDGAVCEMHEGLTRWFCVWPFDGGSSGSEG
jgi:hypothetical protein